MRAGSTGAPRRANGRATKRLTRRERQQQTRGALLDAAQRVFAERGLQGSSIEEICAQAGYTRGAFYSNFSSKQQLIVELLHDRLFDRYAEMAEPALRGTGCAPTLRETGEMLAAIQARREDRWLLVLWLECLATAGRDRQLRKLAASFWRGNRGRIAELLRHRVGADEERARALATAMIALDIGLAIQHFVDPDEAPLEFYPELYSTLSGSVAAGRSRGGRPPAP